MDIDVKALGKVAVLMGGWSGEREVSLMSGQGVLGALQAEGVDAHAFDPQEQSLEELKHMGFSRCFIALHGLHGEDGAVQGALEILGIPYTGSGVMASSIGMDKVMTKRVWNASGLPTPTYRVIQATESNESVFTDIANLIGFPMIVKPIKEGSSLGVFKVHDIKEFKDAVRQAGEFGSELMCEQFINGDELTCSILGSGATAQALPIIQILAPEGNYDYQHKYFSNDTHYECPAKLSMDENNNIQMLALKAYNILNCRGWGRVDVMFDRTTRKPYLLEVNTSPGMTGHSLVPLAAKTVGIPYGELCVRILADATLDSQVGKNK